MLTSIRSKLKQAGPAAFVLGAAIFFGIRFFLLISKYSVNVFFWDQWNYLTPFFEGDPAFAKLFLIQDGPVREGIGLIADKYLYPLTAWNTRYEAFMIGAVLFVAMLLALLLKKRLFGRIDYTDALIPAVFLTYSQWEMVVGTPNPSYSAFPILMLMLYALALLQRSYLVRSIAILLLNFLLIYTCFGIFAGVVTIGLFAFDVFRNWRGDLVVPVAAPLLGLTAACLSLASFFVNYQFTSAVDCFAGYHRQPVAFTWFLALMLSSYAAIRNQITAATLLGSVLLLVVIFVLVVSVRRTFSDRSRQPVALVMTVLIGFSLLFMLNAAYGRSCLGIVAAKAPRYPTLLIPAFLGVYFFLTMLPSLRLKYSALGVFALILIPGHTHIPDLVDWYSNGKGAWAACYRSHGDVDFCNAATNFRVYPAAGEGVDQADFQRKLDYLKKNKLNLFAE